MKLLQHRIRISSPIQMILITQTLNLEKYLHSSYMLLVKILWRSFFISITKTLQNE
nr:MAG TPA: hypothetical protein [Caudoviricetes sp.]